MEELTNMSIKESKINAEEHKDSPIKMPDDIFYIKHLDILLKPLVDICNKQIVDLVYYVYKKSGHSHFDFLFKVFKDEAQLIELNLLAAKTLKEKTFDLSILKQILEEEKNEIESIKGDNITSTCMRNDNSELEVKNNEEENKSENTTSDNEVIIKKDISIEVGSFSNSSSSEDNLAGSDHLETKPFFFHQSYNYHLQKSKKLLLAYSKNSQLEENDSKIVKEEDMSFYVDNLCTYLSMKYDKELFMELLKYTNSDAFYMGIQKIPNIPFMFYESAKITKILSKVMRTANCDPYCLESKSSDIKIPINAYTLKYFLELCHNTFFDINSPLSDYILISKSLHFFVEFYRHPAFFKIFYELLNCKISKIEDEIRSNIMANLSLYVDVFYTDSHMKLESSSDDLSNWNLNFNSKSKSLFSNSSETEENIIINKVPSIKKVDKAGLFDAYIFPLQFDGLEQKITNHLLQLFSECYNEDLVDNCHFIENFLLENSIDEKFKVYVLNSIEIIEKKYKQLKAKTIEEPSADKLKPDLEKDVSTTNSFFTKLLDNLKVFPTLNWRYKKVFLQKLDVLEKIGVDRIWVEEQLKNDRVFYIKNMVKRLKHTK